MERIPNHTEKLFFRIFLHFVIAFLLQNGSSEPFQKELHSSASFELTLELGKYFSVYIVAPYLIKLSRCLTLPNVA